MARVYDGSGHHAIGCRDQIDGGSTVSVTRYDLNGYMVPGASYEIPDMTRLDVLDHLDTLESGGYRIERY